MHTFYNTQQFYHEEQIPNYLSEIAPLDDEITVYPNPTSAFLNIDIKTPSPDVVGVCLVDMMGKMVVQQAFVSKMPVHQLPQGVYILYLTDKYGRILGKKSVLIER